MPGTVMSGCLRVAARLVVLGLIYVWYVNYLATFEFYQKSSLYAQLLDIGVPAFIIDYPSSGSWTITRRSLALEVITIIVQLVDAFSVNLALSLGAATQPAEPAYTQPRFLSLLTHLGKVLRPVWMRMHYIVIVLWLADSQIMQHLLPGWLVVTPEITLCCAFLPFALFAFLWVAYVAIATFWRESLWRIVYTISTRTAVRSIVAQNALIAVVVLKSLGVYVPQFDIVLHLTEVGGWRVPFVAIEKFQRVELVQSMLQQSLETCYSLYALYENGSALMDIVFL